MIDLPEQLQGFRFIKLKPDSKEALETGFTDKNNYSYEEIKEEKACGLLIGKEHVVVDIDNKWMANHLSKTNIIPDTLTIKTPGKQGFHFYYKCKDAKARNLTMAGVGIGEIRTGNQYVLSPNSRIKDKKYEIIKSMTIKEITPDELEEKFKRYTTWDSNKKFRPCFLKALKERVQMEDAEGHDFRTALACEARASGLTEEETVSLFCYQDDFSKDKEHPGEKSADHVKKIYNKKLKPWKCETISEKCTMFTDCDKCLIKKTGTKEKDEKPIETSMEKIDGVLWEQIYDPETKQSKFVSWDETKQQAIYEDSLIKNGVKLIPINDDLIKNKAVVLPTGITEYGDETQLDTDIGDFIKKYLDVSEEHRQKSTWYVRLTWVTDHLNTMPYLRALGDYGTGKTRYLDTVGGICYKPMYVGGSVNPAPVYRVINKWRGTAIFDEFTLRESDESTDIIQILNNGFQRGKPVLRCKDGNYSEVESFDPFCPKIMASRQPFKDMALESRCITEVVQETNRNDIPTDLGSTFKKERETLQNKLLLYRLKNWNKIIPSEKNIDFGRIQPRIKQTFLPFTVLFQNDKKILDKFIETVKTYNSKLTEENSTSYDGILVNIYLEFLENDVLEITALELRNELVNKHGYDPEKTGERGIGKRMHTLGFKSVSEWDKTEKKTKRKLTVEMHTIKRLIYRYVDVKEQEEKISLVEKKKGQTILEVLQ